MERGGSLKSPYLIARCIQLNTNILQGSLANIVGTEPIFVSNAELCRFKYVIINTLHFIQLLQGKLGLWVRAPGGFEPFSMTKTNIWKLHIYFIFFSYCILSKTINNQQLHSIQNHNLCLIRALYTRSWYGHN